MIINLSNWQIEQKPRLIYSNGICLVVLFNDNTIDEFIDTRDTTFEEDGEGFCHE